MIALRASGMKARQLWSLKGFTMLPQNDCSCDELYEAENTIIDLRATNAQLLAERDRLKLTLADSDMQAAKLRQERDEARANSDRATLLAAADGARMQAAIKRSLELIRTSPRPMRHVELELRAALASAQPAAVATRKCAGCTQDVPAFCSAECEYRTCGPPPPLAGQAAEAERCPGCFGSGLIKNEHYGNTICALCPAGASLKVRTEPPQLMQPAASDEQAEHTARMQELADQERDAWKYGRADERAEAEQAREPWARCVSCGMPSNGVTRCEHCGVSYDTSAGP